RHAQHARGGAGRPSIATSAVRDPARILMRHGGPVATAAGPSRHFARAKDATKLQQAIRAKLEAQAEFVLWWDTQANKAKPGQPTKNPDGADAILRLGKEGLPAEQVVRRWRSKLNDPDKFETAYEAASRWPAEVGRVDSLERSAPPDRAA